MNFNLKRPCKECPFRSDIRPYLRKSRVREILDALFKQDQTFACHKTLDFDEEGESLITSKSQHCAGALILMEKNGRANQMMRIAERLGLYDRKKLDMSAPVFSTPSAMLKKGWA